MKIKLLLAFLLVSNSYAKSPLSTEQENILQKAYNIGKQIVADNGTTFEWAAAGITFTESSAGKNIIGDESYTKNIREASLGSMQVRLATAKWVIKKDKLMNRYFNFLLADNKEKRLITLLLTDIQFSAMIGITYVKMNYNSALRRKFQRPYFYAISRYNGGSHNYKYYHRFKDNVKKIKKWRGVKND